MGKIALDVERCKGCGYCVSVCSQNLIEVNGNYNRKGYPVAVFTAENGSQCRACKLCAEVCPDAVIEVYCSEEAVAVK